MILKIISKNEKGTKGLREMMKDSKGRVKASFFKVTILDENPLSVNFELKKLSSKFMSNQTIRNTVINGLKEELEREHNLTEKDIKVVF